MKNPIFKGIGTALITPMTETGAIDYAAMERMVQRQLDANIDALIVCATTGEAPTLSDAEKLELFRKCKEYAGDERLERVLGLEDWQVFYVDSTLKHDWPAMIAEYDDLRMKKVSNSSMYQAVQDKWMEQIDKTYEKIFNPEQWAAYLKTGAAKLQKAREKRKAKAAQQQ